MKKALNKKSAGVRYADILNKKVTFADITKDDDVFALPTTSNKLCPAFPSKSFDDVLQPVVDACIEEIENILMVWTKTRCK